MICIKTKIRLQFKNLKKILAINSHCRLYDGIILNFWSDIAYRSFLFYIFYNLYYSECWWCATRSNWPDTIVQLSRKSATRIWLLITIATQLPLLVTCNHVLHVVIVFARRLPSWSHGQLSGGGVMATTMTTMKMMMRWSVEWMVIAC